MGLAAATLLPTDNMQNIRRDWASAHILVYIVVILKISSCHYSTKWNLGLEFCDEKTPRFKKKINRLKKQQQPTMSKQFMH